MSSLGIGEFAFENVTDSGDAIVPERVNGLESELGEGVGGDVVGGKASAPGEAGRRRRDRSDSESGPIEEQLSLVGEPLHGEHVESLPQPDSRVGATGGLVAVDVLLVVAQSLVQGARRVAAARSCRYSAKAERTRAAKYRSMARTSGAVGISSRPRRLASAERSTSSG